jgi:putative DNA primase/helicase
MVDVREIEQSFKTIPVRKDKSPAIDDWRKRARPGYAGPDGVGVACGESGLVIVDLDVHDPKANGLEAWDALGLTDVEKWVVRTPSGGKHIYFKDPTGELRNSTSKIAPGIDTRGAGGQAVMPPTAGYEWIKREGEIPDFPEELRELLTAEDGPVRLDLSASVTMTPERGRKYALGALENEVEVLKHTASGGRNDQLNRSAFNLGRYVRKEFLTRSEVEAALYEACIANDLVRDDGDEAFRDTMASGLNDGIDKREMPSEGLFDMGLVPLLETGHSDEGNAQAVKLLYGDEFLFVTGLGWMRWTGTHWEAKGAEAALDRAIVDTLKKRRVQAIVGGDERIVKESKPSNYKLRAAKNMLSSILYAHINDFDGDKDRINVENGVLDLRNGQLEEHDPKQRYTYCLPVGYNPEASSELWESKLEEWVPDPEVRDFLQRAVGYSLTGRTREEKLFYIYGPPRAGKGTFSETLIELLGRKPLATAISFTAFAKNFNKSADKYELAQLRPCRFVAASESGESSYINTRVVKNLTGGDLITTQHKYKDPFTFRPQFKIWLITNPAPYADANDEALWGRFHVIHFPNSWLGKEDQMLKYRLRQLENLEGVLAWAVQGALLWYSDGLDAPKAVVHETKKVRDDQDWVAHWVAAELEITGNKDDRVPNSDLYPRYVSWTKKEGTPTLGERQLGRNLSRLEIDPYRTNSERGREGVKLIPVSEVDGFRVNIGETAKEELK